MSTTGGGVVPPNGVIFEPGTNQRLYEGDSVLFTVRPKYINTGENLWLRSPYRYAWTYRADSSASAPAPAVERIPGCFDDSRTCNFKASKSGTLTLYYSFSADSNVPIDSVQVHVEVITCPWRDDPIMDSPVVRRQLRDQFRVSDSTQLERGGGIYRDESGGYYVDYRSGPIAPTQCQFFVATITQAGYTLVGIWHTHPAKNTVLTNCPTRPPGSRTGVGPSRPDFDAQRKFNPLPAYIIDRDEIWRIQNAPSRPWWYFWTNPQAVSKKAWRTCPNWAA